MTPTQRLHGLLLGTAIGDSVGLPAEGLSPQAIARRKWNTNWRHRLFFGRGFWSGDTEHTLILAQALNHSEGDPVRFQHLLARGLRHWLLLLPAGVGLATARAIFKLWLGFPPGRSGVFSAGNGPCMRAALLGAVFHDDPEKRLEFNRLQTRITHTDPKAEWCSRAIVELSALFYGKVTVPAASEIIKRIRFKDADASYRALIDSLETSLSENASLETLLERLGANPQRGVSGYCFHTLTAVLHCGIAHDWTPASALPAIWAAGGDTDTTGAILGALCGVLRGPEAFPSSWIDGVMEFPTTIAQFEAFACATTELRPATIRPAFTPLLVLRNLVFLAVVLFHGLARLIPFRSGR